MILEKKSFQLLLLITGIIALSFTAEKCRQLVGKGAASNSGDFTFLNCFDGGSGTVACLVKEGVKLYFYNIRGAHVERARNQAIETAIADALSQGMNAKAAAKQAQKEGAKAAKLATRKAKRIIGPIISSGWDFFETLYLGGTMTEGFLRGTGTLIGAYSIGFIGEQRFGRFGYLVGSELGSWVGGKIGLMMYDVVNGVHFLLEFSQQEETKSYESPSDGEVYEATTFESFQDSPVEETFTSMTSEFSESSQNSPVEETTTSMTSEFSESYQDSPVEETSTSMTSEFYEETNTYDAPVNVDSDIHEEF